MEQPCAECGKTFDEYVSERAARSAQPPTGTSPGGDGAHIPVTAALHCDWCAAVDAYLANQHLERQMAEWAMTRREQAEERTR